MNNILVTGRCGSTFGVDGTVRLRTNNSLENLKNQEILTLRKNGVEFQLKVKKIYSASGQSYISFYGVDSKEEASKVLTNAEILVERKNAKKLNDKEVYCSDLVGLNVFLDDEKVGKVISWLDGADVVMLEVKTNDGKTHIVPYRDVFVSQPDLENSRIDILKKDLLD